MIKENRSIQSLERGMLVLEYIASRNGIALLSEISKALNLSKSTVHALLNNLLALGYISREGTAYALGLRLTLLSKPVHRIEEDLKRSYASLMQLAAELSGETCYLACPCGAQQYLYLATLNHQQAHITKHDDVSTREDLTSSAIGKVILAHSPALMKSLGRANVLSLEMITELQFIQKNGYAIDQEEAKIGINCLAIPLFQKGQLVAALGVSGKSQDFTLEKMRKLFPVLTQQV